MAQEFHGMRLRHWHVVYCQRYRSISRVSKAKKNLNGGKESKKKIKGGYHAALDFVLIGIDCQILKIFKF